MESDQTDENKTTNKRSENNKGRSRTPKLRNKKKLN